MLKVGQKGSLRSERRKISKVDTVKEKFLKIVCNDASKDVDILQIHNDDNK